MCGPHQVWPLRSECCGRGVPTKVVCAECMKMCCLGGKNSVVKGLTQETCYNSTAYVPCLGNLSQKSPADVAVQGKEKLIGNHFQHAPGRPWMHCLHV